MPKIYSHVSATGRNELQNEYNASTLTMQASFTVALDFLHDQPRANWTRPSAAQLTKVGKGEFRDYFEIRFRAESAQQRPIGYFGPKENQFTILIWATEKGGRLVPPNWRSTADLRRKAIEAGEASVKEFEC